MPIEESRDLPNCETRRKFTSPWATKWGIREPSIFYRIGSVWLKFSLHFLYMERTVLLS